MRVVDSQRGAGAIEVVILMGVSLLLVLAFANLAVNDYIKGMAHSAVDQGARAGARRDAAVSACETRSHQVLANLLAGPAGAGATVSCSDDGEVVTAVVRLHLATWVPGFPDSDVDVTGQARKEGLR